MADTFVIDCSVAAKWILPEPGRDVALTWLDRWTAGEVNLIAPDLLLAEFSSLLAKRVRRKQIPITEARQAAEWMNRSAPRLYGIRPLLKPALKLAFEHQLSLWDSI